MTRLRSNFKNGTLTAGVNAAATTLSSAGFAALPEVAGGDTMPLVLDPAATAGAPEIVSITAHTAGATSVTVTRGAESTTARSHSAAVEWVHAATARDFQDFGGQVWFDDTGVGPTDDYMAVYVNRVESPSPGYFSAATFRLVTKGDNTTFKGGAALTSIAMDDASVDSSTKGVLYGFQSVVWPRLDRNNIPYDDVVGISVENQGVAKGTDGIYIGHNRDDVGTSPTAQDWANVIQCDAHSDNFIRSVGTHAIGLSLSGATISVAAIRIGNAQKISSIMADGTTLQPIMQLDSSDVLRLYDGAVRIFGTGELALTNNKPIQARNAANSSYLELLKLTAGDNLSLYAARAVILSNGGVLLNTATSTPSAPGSNGFVIYNDAGVLKAKSSAGTVTTLAAL